MCLCLEFALWQQCLYWFFDLRFKFMGTFHPLPWFAHVKEIFQEVPFFFPPQLERVRKDAKSKGDLARKMLEEKDREITFLRTASVTTSTPDVNARYARISVCMYVNMYVYTYDLSICVSVCRWFRVVIIVLRNLSSFQLLLTCTFPPLLNVPVNLIFLSFAVMKTLL